MEGHRPLHQRSPLLSPRPPPPSHPCGLSTLSQELQVKMPRHPRVWDSDAPLYPWSLRDFSHLPAPNPQQPQPWVLMGLQMASLATLPVEIPTAGRSCRASVSFYCGSLERITAELKMAIRPGPQASLESTDGGSQTRVDPLPHSTQARAGWTDLLFSFFPANPTRLRGHLALESP